jgi:hypothetical protein
VKRFVIVTIDSIYQMLYDYAGESLGLPEDAKPIKFRLVQGKLQLMVEADSWEEDQQAEQIKFDMKRVWGVQ